MQQRDEKFIRAKCADLISTYGDLLREIADDEIAKLIASTKLGTSEFEIVKDAIYTAGMREGMRSLLAKVNELARRKEAN